MGLYNELSNIEDRRQGF